MELVVQCTQTYQFFLYFTLLQYVIMKYAFGGVRKGESRGLVGTVMSRTHARRVRFTFVKRNKINPRRLLGCKCYN